MLEAAIQDLATAIRDLTAALKAGEKGPSRNAAEDPKTVTEEPKAPEPEPEPYETVAEVVTNLIKAKGREAAVAVLKRFGAKTARDIPPEKRLDFINACFAEYDR